MRVVMIPGFSLAASSWTPILPFLDDMIEPVPVDVPDHGDFAAAAAAIAERAGRAVYAGYSMGGRLALQLALSHPELVEGLIVISASPGIDDHAARRRRRHDDEALADWIDEHRLEAFLDRWLARPVFEDLDPALARRHRLSSPPAIASQLRRLGQGVQPSLWDRLAELEMPTLLVAGELDPKYVTISAEMLSHIGMNAELKVIPECAHAVTVEWPGAVATLISEFVTAHWPTSTS